MHKGKGKKEEEGELVEEKKALVLRFTACSDLISRVLDDLCVLKKSGAGAIRFTRKDNKVQPFEEEASIEGLCASTDAALFAYGSHSKKRPHNLILGRIFDGHLLDMIEFGVTRFISMAEFAAAAASSKTTEGGIPISKTASFIGAIPCMVFIGEGFLGLGDSKGKHLTSVASSGLTPEKMEIANAMKCAKDLLLDWFKGREVSVYDLASLDFALVFTGTNDGKIYMRTYRVGYMKAAAPQQGDASNSDGIPVPKVHLSEMGPSLDLTVRRSRLAAPSLAYLARKQPPKLRGARKIKNVTRDEVRGNVGKVHIKSQTQDMNKLVTRSRFKVLRKPLPKADDGEKATTNGKRGRDSDGNEKGGFKKKRKTRRQPPNSGDRVVKKTVRKERLDEF